MRKIPGIVLRQPHLLKFVFDGIASWTVEDQRLQRRTNDKCEKDIMSLSTRCIAKPASGSSRIMISGVATSANDLAALASAATMAMVS